MKKLNGFALGTFPFANVFGKVEENTVREVIKEFIENGGEFIHVSLVYNNCEVEKMLGKILKTFPRDSYKIMACCGWGIRDDKLVLSGKEEDVKWCCDGVLERLGLDYIDVLMSHGPDITTPYEETIDAMSLLCKHGKTKELCVSNVTLDQLAHYNYCGSVKYIQNRYSLLNQSISDEMFDYCQSNNIKITTYQCIERGILTNKILNGIDINDSDLRSKKPEFQKEKITEIMNWVKIYIAPIAKELNVSIQTLVLYWTLNTKPIYSAVCGISKPMYFEDYYDVHRVEIPLKYLNKINYAYLELEKEIKLKYEQSVSDYLGIKL